MSIKISEWLNALGALTAGAMNAVEARAKVAAYVPLLAQRFPPEAFCAASLEAVAERCRFFPAYAEVAEFLSAWWRDNRPRHAMIEAAQREPEREPPTEQQKAQVSALVASFAAEMRAKRAPERAGAVKPSYLTPEQLRRAHAAQGTVPGPYLRGFA